MPDRQHHIRLSRILAAVVGALAVAVMGAGLAWACTPEAVLELDTVAGPPGTEVNVSGGGFPANGHVEVRLDTADRPLLGRRDIDKPRFPGGMDFKDMKVRIPNRPPGVYTVIGEGYDEQGKLASGEATNNQKTFEITKAPPVKDNVAEDKGKAPPPPSGPASPTDDRETSGAGADGSPATARGARSDRPTTGRSGSGGTESTRGAGDPSRAGDPSPNGGAPREGSGDFGLVTAPSGQSLFRDSLPSAAITGGRRPFGQPSGRSASGDLWSGFGAGRTPSLEPRRADPPAEEDAGLDIGLAAGTGFLGLGLAALFGSFLVAEVRRRRKAVHA